MTTTCPSFEATFPGTATGVGALRRAAGELAERCGMALDKIDAVRLAASEAATNAVIHAYRDRPGELRLQGHIENGELRMVIADDGAGLKPRSDSPGLGLGLPIMAQVTKHFEIVSGPSGTAIHLAFACPSQN
jgi:serine/threonine-protein kinase RsbW